MGEEVEEAQGISKPSQTDRQYHSSEAGKYEQL